MVTLHKRNRHTGRYDMERLIEVNPLLGRYVAPNRYGDLSIDFFDSQAVKELNRALLFDHYGLTYWDIPPQYLTPPIPGRADYIHHLYDLISPSATTHVRCLDVGVGANCIYPIIGCCEYGWEMVGSDIDPVALDSSRNIVNRNISLQGDVELRQQKQHDAIFDGVIHRGEVFNATLCNPPFHKSATAAAQGTMRKLRNLGGGSHKSKLELNFGGRANELWCEGGELAFVEKMIRESYNYRTQCHWFTTLISNGDNLAPLRRVLANVGVAEKRIIEMGQGNKRSRILAWRF